MLKRLSASTMLASALVLGMPMAAHAFEITLSGDSEFKYQTWSDDEDNMGQANDSKMTNESHIIISAEKTSDSGLTYGTYYRIEAETGNGGSSNLKEDGHRLYVKGDFGQITLGGGAAGDTFYADVLDRMVNDEATSGEGLPGFNYFTAFATADETMSYHTPSFSGFKGGISVYDAGASSKGDVRELGLQYTADVMMDSAITLRYAHAQADDFAVNGSEGLSNDLDDDVDVGDAKAQSYGVDFTTGPFGFGISRNIVDADFESDTIPDQNIEVSNTGFAASYQASDALKITLGKVTSEAENSINSDAVFDGDITAFAADYTVAPGLTTGLTYSTWEGQNSFYGSNSGQCGPDNDDLRKCVKDADGKQSGNYTVLYMKVAF